jgi:hypothetical protein
MGYSCFELIVQEKPIALKLEEVDRTFAETTFQDTIEGKCTLAALALTLTCRAISTPALHMLCQCTQQTLIYVFLWIFEKMLW